MAHIQAWQPLPQAICQLRQQVAAENLPPAGRRHTSDGLLCKEASAVQSSQAVLWAGDPTLPLVQQRCRGVPQAADVGFWPWRPACRAARNNVAGPHQVAVDDVLVDAYAALQLQRPTRDDWSTVLQEAQPGSWHAVQDRLTLSTFSQVRGCADVKCWWCLQHDSRTACARWCCSDIHGPQPTHPP